MRKRIRIFFLLTFILGALSLGGVDAASPTIHVLRVDGIIVPVVAGFIDQGITEAENRGATALVIELNTPGGLLAPTERIVDRILGARVPVIVYVDRWAGSAGTFITLASHIAAMAPGSRIGAATPVAMGEEMPEELKRKITEDVAARIRSIAEMRGRDPEQAELTVREGKSFTDSEALEANLIDLRADSLRDIISQLDGMAVTIGREEIILNTQGYVLEMVEMTWVQRFLHAISNPNIAFILLSIGSLGLMLELFNPGTIFPGVIGAISLLLAFYSLAVLDAEWAGVILILLAFALFATEMFVPSEGLLTAGGLASLVIGALILFAGAPMPGLAIDWWLIAIVAVSIGAFFVFVIQAVVRTQRRKQPTGQESLIGMAAEVKTALNPRGTVFVHGELWGAILDEGRADPGEEVTITDVKGLKLRVTKK